MSRVSFVWNYFTEISASFAQCKLCQKSIKRASSSTSAMKTHLATHNIVQNDSIKRKPEEELQNAPKFQKTVNDFIKRESLGEILAKCAAVDGFSIAAITKSEAIIGFVSSRNLIMPKSESGKKLKHFIVRNLKK